MIYILILILVGSGTAAVGTTATAEFNSKANCDRAGNDIIAALKDSSYVHAGFLCEAK
jgi:hypothetical protein